MRPTWTAARIDTVVLRPASSNVSRRIKQHSTTQFTRVWKSSEPAHATAAALEGQGAETLAEQALAAKDYAGAAGVYNPRTELSAEWSTHAERRYPLEGRGPSRMTMNLSSGMRETKDYAGAAAVLDTALIELQRTSGGAASHSTTTAEELIALAQHELRGNQLHGSPHAGKP